MKLRTLIVFLLCLGSVGCGPKIFNEHALKPGDPGTEAQPITDEYRLHVGDSITLKFYYNTDLNQDVVVLPDGTISVILLHELKVVGMTLAELRTQLVEGYTKYLPHPEVSVLVKGFGAQKVFVAGEVGKPGSYPIIGPTSVFDAVALAAGFKDTARGNEIIVVRRGPDYQPYFIAIDLDKFERGIDGKQDVFLQPYDLVYVPKSRIANVDLWFAQYLRGTVGSPSEFVLYYNATK